MSTTLTTRQTAGTGATVKNAPLTNAEVDTNFLNLNVAVQPSGGTVGQVLSKIDGTDFNSQWIDNFSTAVRVTVKAGVALSKGQAVYVTGASGANIIVGLSQANTEATSSKTFGLINNTLALNDFGDVICEGPISGLDTSMATEGDPVWLSPTTAGGLVYGLANKPSAPDHMVYLGVVTRAHATQGQIQVKVQNGYELEELHNVQISSLADNQVLQYEAATSLWKNKTLVTLPSQTGNTGKFLTTDGTNASWDTVNLSAYLPLAGGTMTGAITFAAGQTWPTFNQSTTGNAATATYLSATQQTNAILGATTSMPMSTAGGAAGSFVCKATGTGDSNLAGITFWNDAYAIRMGIRADGYFGLGGWSRAAWSWYSDPSGNMVAAGNVTAYSDERKKKNWRDVPTDLVDQLATVKHGVYDRTDEELTQIGVSAQSLQNIMPLAVTTGIDGWLAVNYGSAALVSAIQLAKRLIALEAKVAKIVE